MPLTTRPRSTSKQGMIRLVSMRALGDCGGASPSIPGASIYGEFASWSTCLRRLTRGCIFRGQQCVHGGAPGHKKTEASQQKHARASVSVEDAALYEHEPPATEFAVDTIQ